MSFWSDKSKPFSGNKTLKCGNNVLNVDKPLVMGILNLTPDSFFDGGRYTNMDDCISHTKKMIEDGASIIDLGAVSTRPGADYVSEEQEIARLLPALTLLISKYPKIVFSVDTYRSKVAKLAADAGAGIINDVSGGSMDSGLIETVAQTGLPYILMHMQGTPPDMQKNPVYENVTNDICNFFEENIVSLHESGIQQLILDPGFGFGKSIEHNFRLLRELSVFKQLNFPLLVGISRKSMIYKLLEISPEEALTSTSALQMVALLNGADILRVHDVKEAVQVVKLAEIYLRSE
jgi:dihydropteroate synthase